MKHTGLKTVKRLMMSFLVIITLGAGAFVANIQAQTANVFEIQIPFDFVVKEQTYKSGTYRIGRLNKANPDTLILKNADDKTLLILLTQQLNSGIPIRFSKLTFSRYGETYFLDSIRASGESYESRLLLLKSDKRRIGTAQLSEIAAITKK